MTTITTPLWHPIESANKVSGKWILISTPALAHAELACWHNYYGFWVNYEGNPVYPTHWMPLPEPPKESKNVKAA